MAPSGKLAPREAERVDVDAFAEALARYDAVNRSLLEKPIRPGFVWDPRKRRLVLRGEFADVPRRFLRFDDRREGYGDVDDRAHEFHYLGITTGDDLIAWMQTVRRPVRKEFLMRERKPAPPANPAAVRARVAKHREARAADRCQVSPKHTIEADRLAKGLKTCFWCSYSARVRMARRRESAKEMALIEPG